MEIAVEDVVAEGDVVTVTEEAELSFDGSLVTV